MEQAADGERPGIDKRFDFFVGCCDYFRYLPDLNKTSEYIYLQIVKELVRSGSDEHHYKISDRKGTPVNGWASAIWKK